MHFEFKTNGKHIKFSTQKTILENKRGKLFNPTDLFVLSANMNKTILNLSIV